MGGDVARDVHADRGELAVFHPHAGEVRPLAGPGTRPDPFLRERGDEGPLKRPHIADHVVDPDDRVADQLTRPVIGDFAAPVGLHDVDSLHPVPLLAHRQLARG